jgi:hypothetical protein
MNIRMLAVGVRDQPNQELTETHAIIGSIRFVTTNIHKNPVLKLKFTL